MSYTDKEKQREYQRRWAQQRRQAFLEDKQCVLCGSTSDLQVDHIDPKQKISHNVWSWSEERRHEELLKCQVLCVSCHKVKTRNDIGGSLHGITGYKRRGCRCEVCRYANAQRMVRQRARKQAKSL